MKDEQRRSKGVEYFSKYQRVLMKSEITIGFLKVAIAAKGEIVKQMKSGNIPSMKDFGVSRLFHRCETSKDFKNFVRNNKLFCMI